MTEVIGELIEICYHLSLRYLTMSEISLRPRFVQVVPGSPEELLAYFTESLKHPGEAVTGEVVQHHVMIRIPPKEYHYWSPELDLEISAEEDDLTLVRGLLGPSAGVWTKFVFLYFATGFAALVAGVIATSQYTLGKTMWGLWVMGIALLGVIGTWIMGQTGKRLAHEQSLILRTFVRNRLEDYQNTYL